MAVASVAGTRLAVLIGNKIIVGAGMVLFCAALLWIATVSQSTSYAIIAAQMVVFGTGMGLTQAPATEAIMGAVPNEKAGVGSAVNDATRLFGGTLGVAVIGSVAAPSAPGGAERCRRSESAVTDRPGPPFGGPRGQHGSSTASGNDGNQPGTTGIAPSR